MPRALPLLLLAIACASCGSGVGTSDSDAPRTEWAIAIHGGAGTIPVTMPAETRDAYIASLERALGLGRDMLAGGASGLDVVEAVIRDLEDDPLFNAGKGAVFNHEGEHELDASIMDGRDHACGAVAGVRTVRHPITLARQVMERTKHVLLAGPGAEAFADEIGVERVDPSWFDTEVRRQAWQRALDEEREEREKGTVGVAVLDREGHLAAGTSTGGLTNKRYGRVGDSPIVGAGTWADDATCAVSATGQGEEFIRHGVARSIAARMEFGGESLASAARNVIHGTLAAGDGGIIAVDARGNIVLEFNTPGMYRGSADSTGRFQVAIWD